MINIKIDNEWEDGASKEASSSVMPRSLVEDGERSS